MEMWRQKKKFFKGRKTKATRESIWNTMNSKRLCQNQAAEAFHCSGLARNKSVHPECSIPKPTNRSTNHRSKGCRCCSKVSNWFGTHRRSNFNRNLHRRQFKNKNRLPKAMDLSDPIFRGEIGCKLQSHCSNQFLNEKVNGKPKCKIHPKFNRGFKEENHLLNFHKPPTVLGALTHTPACKAAMKEEDCHSVIWDSGASMNVSFD